MKKIKVMFVGMGKVNQLMAETLLKDQRFEVMTDVFVGKDVTEPKIVIGDFTMQCVWPEERNGWLIAHTHFDECTPPIIIDFSHPSAVLDNVEFYTRNRLPFVLGTTGYDREAGMKEQLYALANSTTASSSVIAPNMAADVVFMTMLLEHAKSLAPSHFEGWHLQINESHQSAKADPSGTALALAKNIFIPMGAQFDPNEDMDCIRDKEHQLHEGVPQEHLDGHGWHTYMLSNSDNTVQLGFVHNINGRAPYIDGTIKAVLLLASHLATDSPRRIFSMQDVVKVKSLKDVATIIASSL